MKQFDFLVLGSGIAELSFVLKVCVFFSLARPILPTTLATVTHTLGTLQITNSLTTNFPRRSYRAQVAL